MADDQPVIRALDMLTDDYPPLLRGRPPYWRPPVPTTPAKACLVPSWRWTHPDATDADAGDLVDLDVNGAWLSPVSGTELAHGPLQHTGERPFDHRLPGYWLIDRWDCWTDDRIVSPLGNQGRRHNTATWVTTPTLALLGELQLTHHWPWDVEVLDSWTSPDRCRLATWGQAMGQMRAEALADRDQDPAYYEAVKLGYTQAIQMMLGPKDGEPRKSKVIRPDWYHTLRASFAARTWRKAWNMLNAGVTIARMAAVDEVSIWAEDLDLFEYTVQAPKAGFALDNTGAALGAFKVKRGAKAAR